MKKLINKLAQKELQDLGFYTGQIDGDIGPLSNKALDRYISSISHGDSNSGSALYEKAASYIGVKEVPGKRSHPKILRWLKALASWINDDATPWCSAFANHVAKECGYETTNKLNARSWLKVGQKVSLEKAKKGDMVILWRVKRTGWQGHIGFFHSYDKKTGRIKILGGNQRDAVNISSYPKSRLLEIRRTRKVN